MNIKEWLNTVGVCRERGNDEDITGLPSKDMVWFSKFDDSYITLNSLVDSANADGYFGVLAKNEVIEQLTHGVGFSPSQQKWYGWSHRAIYGFEIGSTCKKGDCHYQPANKEAFIEDALEFWGVNEYHEKPCYDSQQHSVVIKARYNNKVPNKKLRGTMYRHEAQFPKVYGKGEWTAKTLEDAKQMAIDFNEGVS